VVHPVENIMSEEIDLKRKLVEATNNVRKKFKQIKAANTQSELNLEKFYEPIAKPLASISDAVIQQQQTHQKIAAKAKHQSHSIRASPDSADLSFDTSTPVVSEKILFDTPKRGNNESTIYETPSPSNISSPTLESNKSLLRIVLHNHITELNNKPSLYDNIYGVRYGKNPNHKKTFIGNLEVRFTKNGNVSFYDNSKHVAAVDGTPELYDLLFLKNPPVLDKNVQLNENFIQNYKKILQLTNAPYTNYDENMGLRKTRWKKYVKIIKPPMMMETKLGDGIKKNNKRKTIPIPNKKQLSFNHQEYVYWNKPKELVDRLRLLWSSKVAGHTGHDNEIMSIIEELREDGIIY
jgi:hypothetical protein